MAAWGEKRNGGRAGSETGPGGGAKVAYVGGVSQGVGMATGARKKGMGAPTFGGRATTAYGEVTQLGREGAIATAAKGGEAGSGGTTERKGRVLACTECGE